jgi:hypothetical protein
MVEKRHRGPGRKLKNKTGKKKYGKPHKKGKQAGASAPGGTPKETLLFHFFSSLVSLILSFRPSHHPSIQDWHISDAHRSLIPIFVNLKGKYANHILLSGEFPAGDFLVEICVVRQGFIRLIKARERRYHSEEINSHNQRGYNVLVSSSAGWRKSKHGCRFSPHSFANRTTGTAAAVSTTTGK